MIFLHVAPLLTCSSDAEPVKLLFQVTGGCEKSRQQHAADRVNGWLSV